MTADAVAHFHLQLGFSTVSFAMEVLERRCNSIPDYSAGFDQWQGSTRQSREVHQIHESSRAHTYLASLEHSQSSGSSYETPWAGSCKELYAQAQHTKRLFNWSPSREAEFYEVKHEHHNQPTALCIQHEHGERWPAYLHHRKNYTNDLVTIRPDGRSARKCLVAKYQAGAVVLHNPHLPHGISKNNDL